MARKDTRARQIAAVSISQVVSGAPRRTQNPTPLGRKCGAAACRTRRASRRMHIAIRARAVAVLAPVARRERRQVQHAAREPAEIGDRTRGRAVVEVLQDVVADHEIERIRRPVRERALRPAEALAEVFAVFETRVLGARKRAAQRRAQQADAAARVEHAAHRQPDVIRVRRDEIRARLISALEVTAVRESK